MFSFRTHFYCIYFHTKIVCYVYRNIYNEKEKVLWFHIQREDGWAPTFFSNFTHFKPHLTKCNLWRSKVRLKQTAPMNTKKEKRGRTLVYFTLPLSRISFGIYCVVVTAAHFVICLSSVLLRQQRCEQRREENETSFKSSFKSEVSEMMFDSTASCTVLRLTAAGFYHLRCSWHVLFRDAFG